MNQVPLVARGWTVAWEPAGAPLLDVMLCNRNDASLGLRIVLEDKGILRHDRRSNRCWSGAGHQWDYSPTAQ